MPTSSERLYTRAHLYSSLRDALVGVMEATDDDIVAEEAERLALRMNVEYDRLIGRAEKREEKEQGLEHRRKRT